MNGMIDREKIIKALERCLICDASVLATPEAQKAYLECEYTVGLYCEQKKVLRDTLSLLKEQESVVHPEPSCEMTFITDCCCDLCGVQLIREDNFCRCCGKRIEWEGR